MPLLYNFDADSTVDMLKLLAQNLQKRRLEINYLFIKISKF